MTYSKQNKKKGTMRKEKPKNQTQKQFVLIFATETEQQTKHHTQLIPKQQQKAASENWQRCSAPATAQRAVKFGNRAPTLSLFFLI